MWKNIEEEGLLIFCYRRYIAFPFMINAPILQTTMNSSIFVLNSNRYEPLFTSPGRQDYYLLVIRGTAKYQPCDAHKGVKISPDIYPLQKFSEF